MAEIVSLHVESMIPELEHMRRLKLYTNDEITIMIKRRKEYEYKIARKSKIKQDFLRYINYEVKILHDIKLRRDKYKITEKKNEIEYTIAKRVVKLYNTVINYFKSDVNLWMSYVNFCTQVRFGNVVTEAFKELLQVHGDKSQLWLYAARWELEESNNVDGALNYVMAGLHRHPDAPDLLKQAFTLELMSAKHKRAVDLDVSDEERKEKAVARAEVQFKHALNAIGNDASFIVSLLEVATTFDFTKDLQNVIIEHLTSNCWKSVEMWDAMAQRELQGHHYNPGEHNNRVKLCVAVYKSAVKALPTREMWVKYVDRLLEIQNNKKLNVSIRENLQQTFQEASTFNYLLEKHYIAWVELLDEDPKRLDVLIHATEAIPDSVDLWVSKLRYYITENDEKKISETSQDAMAALGNRALPVYQTIIQYYQLQNKNNEIKQIYELGIAQGPEISVPLRPQYIEWINIVRNTKCAHQEYDKLAQMPPYSLELHNKMVQLELGRFTPNVASIRNIFKLAILQLGKESTDVWINQIKFEISHGDPSVVSGIYYTAKHTLNTDLVSKFTTEYAILNTQM